MLNTFFCSVFLFHTVLYIYIFYLHCLQTQVASVANAASHSEGCPAQAPRFSKCKEMASGSPQVLKSLAIWLKVRCGEPLWISNHGAMSQAHRLVQAAAGSNDVSVPNWLWDHWDHWDHTPLIELHTIHGTLKGSRRLGRPRTTTIGRGSPVRTQKNFLGLQEELAAFGLCCGGLFSSFFRFTLAREEAERTSLEVLFCLFLRQRTDENVDSYPDVATRPGQSMADGIRRGGAAGVLLDALYALCHLTRTAEVVFCLVSSFWRCYLAEKALPTAFEVGDVQLGA